MYRYGHLEIDVYVRMVVSINVFRKFCVGNPKCVYGRLFFLGGGGVAPRRFNFLCPLDEGFDVTQPER